MRIEKTEGSEIDKYCDVKVTEMGSILEVMYQRHIPSEMPFDRVPGMPQLYSLKKTGEIKEFMVNEKRTDDFNGLRATFKMIRNCINNNFFGLDNEAWITLTYAENMTDTVQLYNDFTLFWKKFKYAYGKDCEYLIVVEPQGRGAWHLHLLVKKTGKFPFINNNNELAPMWGHGFTKIRSLKGIDNIGAYLSAYLGDIEIPEEQDIPLGKALKIREVEGKKKGFVKGGRLEMYPANMQIMRKSRGIIPPVSEMMNYEKLQEKIGAVTSDFSKTIRIYDDDDTLLNVIIYENYNTNRKSSK